MTKVLDYVEAVVVYALFEVGRVYAIVHRLVACAITRTRP